MLRRVILQLFQHLHDVGVDDVRQANDRRAVGGFARCRGPHLVLVVDPRRWRAFETKDVFDGQVVETALVAALLKQLEQHQPCPLCRIPEGIGVNRSPQSRLGRLDQSIGKEDRRFVDRRAGAFGIQFDGVGIALPVVGTEVDQFEPGVLLRQCGDRHRLLDGLLREAPQRGVRRGIRKQGCAAGRPHEVARHLGLDGVDLRRRLHREGPREVLVGQGTVGIGGLRNGRRSVAADRGRERTCARLGCASGSAAFCRGRLGGVLRIFLEEREDHAAFWFC